MLLKSTLIPLAVFLTLVASKIKAGVSARDNDDELDSLDLSPSGDPGTVSSEKDGWPPSFKEAVNLRLDEAIKLQNTLGAIARKIFKVLMDEGRVDFVVLTLEELLIQEESIACELKVELVLHYNPPPIAKTISSKPALSDTQPTAPSSSISTGPADPTIARAPLYSVPKMSLSQAKEIRLGDAISRRDSLGELARLIRERDVVGYWDVIKKFTFGELMSGKAGLPMDIMKGKFDEFVRSGYLVKDILPDSEKNNPLPLKALKENEIKQRKDY